MAPPEKKFEVQAEVGPEIAKENPEHVAPKYEANAKVLLL